ncbi:MAG: DUF2141 domain-containing protein [Flavobacteriales bacterium]|nr:DUF2141 domain-containing protein [Flavobacteriales bacterium]
MKKTINRKEILALGLMMTVISAIAQNNSRGTLTIKADNFSNNKGQAVIKLFQKDDDVFGDAFIQLSETIKNGTVVFTFENIPFEDYAATIFHDENSNGILDHKFAFPNEPMGFSNDWRFTVFSGMPNFTKLSFKFSILKSEYQININ